MNIISDSASNGSDTSDDKTFIHKLLGEMKNQFNKTEIKPSTQEEAMVNHEDIAEGEDSAEVPQLLEAGTESEELEEVNSASTNVLVDKELSTSVTEEVVEKIKPEDNSNAVLNEMPEEDANESQDETSEKPRLVMKFLKPSNKTNKTKTNNYNCTNKKKICKAANGEEKTEKVNLKRSSRRRSCESILQSAIARKEKSYNEATKPQRLSRQLKPTQKILDNLASAAALKHEKNKIKLPKNVDKQKHIGEFESDASFDKMQSKSDALDTPHKRHKYKHHHGNKFKKGAKKMKYTNVECSKDSDSDQNSIQESKDELLMTQENKFNSTKSLKNKLNEEKMYRRSQRLSSSSRAKDEDEENEMKPEHPSTAEQQSLFPAEPECSSVGAELIASRLCLCIKSIQLYTLNEKNEIVYCKAVDNVGDKLVGCNNVIEDKEIPLFRTSKRVPYTLLCEVHRNRLYRHNCCPTCGIFCTQGRFVQCENNHIYHRVCQICVGNAECCPHCGSPTPKYDVHLSMESATEPTILPMQKAHYSSAKMTFQPKLSEDESYIKRAITPPLIPPEAIDIPEIADMEFGTYDIETLFQCVKEQSLEKLAFILGSKSVPLMTVIDESNGFTLLHYAVKKGFLPVVHMLLMAGMEVDVYDFEQNTPLMTAIFSEENDVVKYLIKVGGSITLKGTDGMTALHLAAKCGNLKACHLLIAASIGIKNYIDSVDDGGWTSLVWACEHGHVSVAKYLVTKGADLFLRDVEQNVALHWAAFSGSTQIIEMLLNMGSNINAVNAHGDSPLHIGARQDNYNSIIILLARGANISIINKVGESAIDCTTRDGHCYKALLLNVQLRGIIGSVYKQKYILTNDMSRGKEQNPIQCLNMIDNEPKPADFVYISKNCFTTDINVDLKITSLQSCGCEDRCTSTSCSCGNNSIRCWYDEDGKLSADFNFADPPMIFECNEACSCNAITCNNRVVQHGLTQRFQLFRTETKGWGIRTLKIITKGTFVCEYIGEIINDYEADQREDDSYLFDLDNRESDAFCIDARHYGNFSRFINHSCSPNLIPIRLFIEHQDLRFPRIAFFANRDILIDEELSFDYGEKFWIIKYKSFTCECGNGNCKYSEDNIAITIDKYNRRILERHTVSENI